MTDNIEKSSEDFTYMDIHIKLAAPIPFIQLTAKVTPEGVTFTHEPMKPV